VLRFQNSEQIDIYYSLDGTAPDDSALPYQAPIPLDTTTAVRAIGYKRGFAPSDVVTHTYFVDEAVNLPFISIVTDPDNFFSNERGIYVTGTNGKGGYCDSAIRNLKQDWERPANVELYERMGLGLTSKRRERPSAVVAYRFLRSHWPVRTQRVRKGSFEYQLFQTRISTISNPSS
jgi:hypothetical protein